MEIHPAKSKILHIGKENPGLPYWLNGSEIPMVAMEKDIGFWMSEDLSAFVENLCAESERKGTGGDHPDTKKLLVHR